MAAGTGGHQGLILRAGGLTTGAARKRGGSGGRVTISERIAAARRERRVLARVSQAAWRLDQAERERTWALASARAEGISIRTLAAAIGLSPSRVHQIVAAAADLDTVTAALGELRVAGWSAPEDPDSGEDTELDGRDNIADRLSDGVSWLRQCASWLRQLDRGGLVVTRDGGIPLTWHARRLSLLRPWTRRSAELTQFPHPTALCGRIRLTCTCTFPVAAL